MWLNGPLRTSALRLVLVAVLVTLGASDLRAQEPAPRSKVARRKALFIEQFTRLIEWPSASLPRDAPFVICIQGTSDTADELANIAVSRNFKGRPSEVRRLDAGASPGPCHVLYLAGSETLRLPRTLAEVADKPVLTVSDTPGFVEQGVQFNLFDEARSAPRPGTYVGFELNVPAVKRSALVFDPRLLSAGRRVDTPPRRDSTPARPGP
jgi:hypothetical protein